MRRFLKRLGVVQHALQRVLERQPFIAADAGQVGVLHIAQHGRNLLRGAGAFGGELDVDDPSVGGLIVSGYDVTDRERLAEELSYQAFHDSLTGLGNRALFLNRLDHALERSARTGEQVAALFLDMDGLKDANDRLGHSAGDTLLQSMGGVLMASIRKSDTAARLGGDEFAVIVEDFDHPGEVFALAGRILEECRQPMVIAGETVTATVSIGFSFSKPGITVDELMSNADRAMYTAKYRGKDRYEQFEEWMLSTAEPV